MKRKMNRFFLRSTKKQSIREPIVIKVEVLVNGHYGRFKIEKWCTITSLPFFLVAWYYNDPVVLFAAWASTLSHFFNKQFLHDLDMLAVFLIFAKVCYHIQMVMENTSILQAGGVAIALNIADTSLNRGEPRATGVWLHCIWHLSAAFALFYFNSFIYTT